MSDANDRNLGLDEIAQLRWRVLDGIHARPYRRVGGVIAGAAAVVTVSVVVAVAWTAAATRPTTVAATPSPSPTASAPSSPEGLWTSKEVDGAYMYLDPNGTFTGGDGCNAHGGTWSYEDRARSIIVLDGYESGKICLERPDGEAEGTTQDPVPDLKDLSIVETLLIPARLQATGDTLHGVDGDGDTVTLHRSPTVEVKAGTILARAEKPEASGDGAQLEGALTRTESGVLGIGDTPVVFPAGTRLLDDGQGIHVDGVGTILLGEEISAGGGTNSRQTWGPPLPYGNASFLAWHITR